jgi:hypothetical protein
MAETALFTDEEHITTTIADYEARLARVRERYDAYHLDMHSRRYVGDEYRDTQSRIVGTRKFLAGDYDATYCSGLGFATVEKWRAHYADDTLRAALHHLLWAEHYAGLRDRDSTRAFDPWNSH